jgi:hypothetical protein
MNDVPEKLDDRTGAQVNVAINALVDMVAGLDARIKALEDAVELMTNVGKGDL